MAYILCVPSLQAFWQRFCTFVFPMQSTCFIHFILFDFIAFVIFHRDYNYEPHECLIFFILLCLPVSEIQIPMEFYEKRNVSQNELM